MECPAGETSLAALLHMQHSPRQPARADHAVHAADMFHQLMESVRRGCAVGIHVTNQVSQWSQLKPFDERAALADGLGELPRADGWILGADAAHHAEGVVGACGGVAPSAST